MENSNRTHLVAYAVKDLQSQLFTNPYFLVNDVIAKRSFENACKDEQTQFNQYPQDYSLYAIGTYNIETGALKPQELRQIANATEFTKTK